MSRRKARRRALSLTSLIDVIFLLLLFFMLSSTFSRFAEVELTVGAAGDGGTADAAPLFLRLAPDTLSLNGELVALDALAGAFPDVEAEAPLVVLVSMAAGVTSQRLTDLLGVLRGVPGIAPTVLGS
ncbi:biopolymer transporter ExbD [Salipiger sp. IMCC34102]|uniref:biopolymer transporter ExbD n=1 Tax=Salipiger sp. IMCC34102 TaxID=2510647 RepID=UPI00210810AE|nr:biopolymer transporter ExbD [Salipiger sp. IMCC34102]